MEHPIEESVRRMVAEGSGLDGPNVIPGNDAGPRPEVVHASVLLVSDQRQGYPDRRDLGDGRTRLTTWRRAEFSVQWYRKGAVAAAHAFDRWAESSPGLDRAVALELRIVFPLEIRRLDEIIGDAWEERAQLDLLVDWADSRTVGGEEVDNAEIAVTLGISGIIRETIAHG